MGTTLRWILMAAAVAPAACRSAPATSTGPARPMPAAVRTDVPCGHGRSMIVRFYDVGQALAVLVALPDGRHIAVDAGDDPGREKCDDCARKHHHLMDALRRDLAGAPIDLLFVTHQHSDHIGGASDLLAGFAVRAYIDNGRDVDKAEVRRAHEAAMTQGSRVGSIAPERLALPIGNSTDVTLTPVVPSSWPRDCASDENECSIGLRIDFCSSSVLFTGDAEREEEGRLDTHGPVGLLQVAHHGSETSSTPAFLSETHPSYAVISAGKPDEGMNRDYCHPRATIVRRLTEALGGPHEESLRSFDGQRCANARSSDWIEVPASDRLWATERDGDIMLTTTGDGVFRRELGRASE